VTDLTATSSICNSLVCETYIKSFKSALDSVILICLNLIDTDDRTLRTLEVRKVHPLTKNFSILKFWEESISRSALFKLDWPIFNNEMRNH